MRRIVVCFAFAPVFAMLLASCISLINTPKEPIKIEVKMEIHIYQHAVQDVGYITGAPPAKETVPETPTEVKPKEETPPPAEKKESGADNVFLRLLGVGEAYAETASDQQQLRRVLDAMRGRYATLGKYKAEKAVGENHSGYVEQRPSPKMSDANYARAVRGVIAAENADRRVLYQIRARMDGVTPEREAAIYAKAWRDSAKPGEWIEVQVGGRWVWKEK